MAERIVLTRWGPGTALGVVVVTAVLAAGPLLGLRNADSTAEKVFLGVLSAVFAAPLVWTLWRLPAVMRGMGVDIDEVGVHPFDGRRTETIAWQDITRVTFSPDFEVYRRGADDPAFRCALSSMNGNGHRLEEAVRRYRP
jgi:hypothetical protein